MGFFKGTVYVVYIDLDGYVKYAKHSSNFHVNCTVLATFYSKEEAVEFVKFYKKN